MTTANVMNSGMANVNAANATNTKANQNTESGNVSKMFQGYMKQYDKTDTVSRNQTINAKSQTGSDNAITDYAQTQYKGNQIQQNSQSTLEEKVSNSKELIQSTEKDIVQAVAEELGFDESKVEEVMETLGLSALQLLQPENLVQLVSQLTETTDPAELLLNVNFQDLMQNMATIGEEFFQKLDVQPNQLDEIVAQMDIVEEPVEVMSEEVPMESIPAINEQEDGTNTSDVLTQNQGNVQKQENVQGQNNDVETQVEVVREDSSEKAEDALELQNDEQADEDTNPQEQKQSEHQTGSMEQHLVNTGENHVFANNMMQTDAAIQPPVTPMYSQSVNQLEIIQQIAEQVKVTVGTEKTSMEMQLNPENLGKVYLEVSTKQGNVNAQITAQNEAVRDAIQAQIATLQDRLSQAGVKVDAIEVTVASHEFERNLEQDQNSKEQGENQSEQMRSGRRNLHMNSLDDLEGLMSEEEILAAQIMKDNGNTVDLTA